MPLRIFKYIEKDFISPEPIVPVYNINHVFNREILQKCENLSDYSLFYQKIKEYLKKDFSVDESVVNAVKCCIENNILKNFLESKVRR